MEYRKRDRITGRKKYVQKIVNIFPKKFRLMLNPRQFAIEKFVEKSSASLKKRAKVLDAGAGPCPYKKLFKHCEYESTDIVDKYEELDFVCALTNIPRKSGTYDAILSTEVLEHVEYPQKVIDELYRVLKNGGRLFLTTPQSWRIHQAPYNYFYFTSYGLISLLKNAGFSEYKVKPIGGYFWLLADTIRFNNLLGQLKSKSFMRAVLAVIEYPFTQIIFPFILFHLDFLDKKRDWTVGYTVEAIK